jgi:hypothetical protein
MDDGWPTGCRRFAGALNATATAMPAPVAALRNELGDVARRGGGLVKPGRLSRGPGTPSVAERSGRAWPVPGRDDDHAYPGSAEEITADLLRAAGVTVTGVDIDELDPALTTGPRRGRKIAQASARIGWTAAGTAEPGQMPVRLGYALAMAAVTGVPVRVAGQLMDQLAVPGEADLAGQFTRDVPLPRRRRGLSRLVGGRKLVRQPAR